MSVRGGTAESALGRLGDGLASTGARCEVVLPDGSVHAIGPPPPNTRVMLRTAAALRAVRRADALALAEAYLAGEVDVDGSWIDVVPVVELLDLRAPGVVRAATRALWPASAQRRRGIAFHYDLPPAFYTAWFERWRSYSHGLWSRDDDDHATAQARKLQAAIDALELHPGMTVVDVGCGWGPFVEYAGARGIRVHAITLSRVQHDFVQDLITSLRLPCTVELADFLDFVPRAPVDGVVFMGALEHVRDEEHVARWCARHLLPGARLWADFCARHAGFAPGAFIARHVWPDGARYVDVPRLVRALFANGFNLHHLADDTRSYASTVRDWAARLEARRSELAALVGERVVRTFLIFLHASAHFLATNRTQAYHLVAGREPAPLRPATRP